MGRDDDTGHHIFLGRARCFEPPVDAGCVSAPGLCANRVARGHPRLSPGADRRRPFPRSLGAHAHTSVPNVTGGLFADATVPDDARRSAEQALRLLLEVLDRRRPAEQMGKLFAPAVVESIKTIVRTPTPSLRLGVASLRRVHMTRASTNAVDVFGTYRRGQRVFAVAGRLHYRSGKRQPGWTVTSLRVG